MIGLSISFCVQDIAEGKVALETVDKIVAGTSASTDEGMDDLIRSYCESYWCRYPQEAERIIRQLLAEGKIEQPRLVNSSHFPMLERGVRWVESEDQIIWYDRMKSRVF